MSTLSALAVLAILGFMFGLVIARQFDSGVVAMAAIMALFTAFIGALQHFWWGWPWWPVVLPAHMLIIGVGMLWSVLDASSPTQDQ